MKGGGGGGKGKQGIQLALKSLKVLEFHYLFSRPLNMLEFFRWP